MTPPGHGGYLEAGSGIKVPIEGRLGASIIAGASYPSRDARLSPGEIPARRYIYTLDRHANLLHSIDMASKFDEIGNEKGDVHHIEVPSSAGGGVHLENVEGGTSGVEWKHIVSDAITAESAERQQTLRDALKNYPKAIFWSFAISLCIVM
jgi:hypothetical protein